jgi:methyltransferase-like protein/cyclopropane fatty-acyl-phospholipid synthase-like methyltransferase
VATANEPAAGHGLNSYDQVPYRSFPFRQSHPDRLATIAALHGITAPPVGQARVLELGCASGGNLLPMADQLPGGRFVGIDGSAVQIDAGRRLIDEAGLKNIELRQQDILTFDEPAGSYDYILCHGVFSWVPDAVQRKILDICGRCLSPTGVAYISYNTNPGWRMRGMIRDIMRYRAQFFSTPAQQLSQARSLLTFLSESVKSENNAYGILLKSELESIRSAEDSYLFHDHLEETNEPLYFHQFCEQAQLAGLQYLGEADYAAMAIENFSDSVRAMLQSVARDVIEMEQYMDFVRNRMFRQTLLCRRDLSVERTPRGRNLLRLEVASNSEPEGAINMAADQKVTFRRASSVISTSDGVVKAALSMLRKAWPSSIPFLDLAAGARSMSGERMAAVQADSMSLVTQRLADTLLRCYGSSHIDLHSSRPAFVTTVSERPAASPLARIQAGHGGNVTDRKHGNLNLDDFHRQLLTLLDGQRDRAQLLDALLDRVQTGGLMVHRDGVRLTEAAALREVVGGWLDPGLANFARLALLVS